jgi:uncharacterized protein (DUF433 family)
MMSLSFVAEAPPIRDADGALRVGRTGVTLETVLWAFQQGATPEDIVDQFPSLVLADVYEVIGYYLRHRDDVDAYLVRQDQQYRDTVEQVRRELPASPLQHRLRARLQR